jgi:hypothetical protein
MYYTVTKHRLWGENHASRLCRRGVAGELRNGRGHTFVHWVDSQAQTEGHPYIVRRLHRVDIFACTVYSVTIIPDGLADEGARILGNGGHCDSMGQMVRPAPLFRHVLLRRVCVRRCHNSASLCSSWRFDCERHRHLWARHHVLHEYQDTDPHDGHSHRHGDCALCDR